MGAKKTNIIEQTVARVARQAVMDGIRGTVHWQVSEPVRKRCGVVTAKWVREHQKEIDAAIVKALEKEWATQKSKFAKSLRLDVGWRT